MGNTETALSMEDARDLLCRLGVTACIPSLFWNLLLRLSSYRLRMPVTEVMVFPEGYGYYVCPRCHITMDREFMSFCDRCGQHLGWKGYKKAKVLYPGNRKEVHT